MGRKSFKEEMGVLERFNQLSPKVFAYVNECLDSKSKADKRWALEWLKTGFTKMIPQKLTGDKDNPIYVTPIYGGNSVSKHDSDTKNIRVEA